MRIKRALAVAGIVLAGLAGTAWAGLDAEASKKCIKCHDGEESEHIAKTPHSVAADPRTPTCVTCHGPSPTHVDKPAEGKRPPPDRSFTGRRALAPAEASEVCQSCHQKDPKRLLWAGSQHPSADVSCSGCHKVHQPRDRVLAKATQADVCYACHKQQRIEVNRPSRHPVPEGRMTCSDCHNSHGSAGPKLVKRDSTNDTCYSCHAEKRGPFVHPHQPVTDDCGSCHNPHGSTVAGMLTARAPILCQQCHTPHVAGAVGAVGGQPGVFPPAVTGQTAPQMSAFSNGKNIVNIWQGRSCMNCHTQVHGSNNPAVTNPTPQYMFR